MLKVELVGGPFDGEKDYPIDDDIPDGNVVWIPGPGPNLEIIWAGYKWDREMRKAHYNDDSQQIT